MAIRKVLRMGDPRLRRVADTVDAFDTPELHELVTDMKDTMDAYDAVSYTHLTLPTILLV